jgi:predicted Zn-dependent protease with MMP-like domain
MRPDGVTEEEFDAMVVAAFDGLPGWVRRAVGEVAVLVEDQPPPGAGPDHGLLLGIYHGVPLTRRGERIPGSLPDRIVLYRLPIVLATADRDGLPARIRSVLLHEIGHAIGMSEARLREMGVT